MIKSAIESQEVREAQLEQDCAKDTLLARQKLSAGQKSAALRILRRVKRGQAELQKVGGVLEKLDAMTLTIESSLHNVSIIQAMKAGSNAMEQLENNFGHVDKIDALMSDMEESLDVQQDIAELLSTPLVPSPLVGHDDETLLAELVELTKKDDQTAITSLPTIPPGNLHDFADSTSIASAQNPELEQIPFEV